jgi:preprotein translocase subunit SecY
VFSVVKAARFARINSLADLVIVATVFVAVAELFAVYLHVQSGRLRLTNLERSVLPILGPLCTCVAVVMCIAILAYSNSVLDVLGDAPAFVSLTSLSAWQADIGYSFFIVVAALVVTVIAFGQLLFFNWEAVKYGAWQPRPPW